MAAVTRAARTGRLAPPARGTTRVTAPMVPPGMPTGSGRIWRMVAVMGILNLCVLFVSIYAESSASKWREEVARLTHVTEQMRTMLSATEAMPRVDERARALGLVRPQMVAYLPMPAPVAPHGRPLPPAVGVGPGY